MELVAGCFGRMSVEVVPVLVNGTGMWPCEGFLSQDESREASAAARLPTGILGD